jgi:hypothetical protein
MRYATASERKQGRSSEPVYLDGNGKFLADGQPPVMLSFEVQGNKPAMQVVDAGTREIDTPKQ